MYSTKIYICTVPTFIYVQYQHLYMYSTNIYICTVPTFICVQYQHLYMYIFGTDTEEMAPRIHIQCVAPRLCSSPGSLVWSLLVSMRSLNWEIRRAQFANTVLSGGNTTCPGIGERMRKEITGLPPPPPPPPPCPRPPPPPPQRSSH